MFNNFVRSSGRVSSLRATLRVNLLEDRNAPSDLLNNEFVPNVPLDSTVGVLNSDDNPGTNWGTYYADVPVGKSNQPPEISITEVVCVAPGYYRISGVVTDENPSGLQVRFSSAAIPGLNGITATTNQNGQYTRTVFVGTARGDFFVQTTDGQGLNSNVADDTIY